MMAQAGVGRRAAVFGAGGGIGAALVAALAARDDIGAVVALSRRPHAVPAGKVIPMACDVGDEASVAVAAQALGPVDLALVATGALTLPGGAGPEKTWRSLDPAVMAESFRINAIGPAPVAKHVLPLLPRDRPSLFAVLSARVGSIADNRLGGWHSYRAAKAALNMLTRNFAIELARTHPLAVCVALHPGTVDTGLSAPFQHGVAPDRLFAPAQAAEHLLRVCDSLAPADSGGFFAWDGQLIPF